MTWVACAALLAACTTPVRSGLRESDANALIVALDRVGIAADKRMEDGAGPTPRYVVAVATSQTSAALRALADERLLKIDEPDSADSYAAPSLLPTPNEDSARWLAATAAELSRSLAHLPDVVDAHVHLARPVAPTALDLPEPPLQGAVLLERRANAAELDDGAVRKLVAAAVVGLEPSRVTIVQVTAPGARAAARLTRVGPFSVASASAGALRATLGIALVLHLGLALALASVVWYTRRRTRTLP